MTKTHTAPVKNTKDLERFILWFLDLPELPLETKKAFVAHLLEKRGFDDVAQEYVSEILHILALASAEKMQEAKNQLAWIEAALEAENDQKTSLATRIAHEAIEKMTTLSDTFKKDLSTFEKNEMVNAEQSEARKVSQNVQHIKKSLKK